MKPRLKYRSRRKKTGARKRQKTRFQKRKLIGIGHDAGILDRMTAVEIRELLRKAMKGRVLKPAAAKKTKGKTTTGKA